MSRKSKAVLKQRRLERLESITEEREATLSEGGQSHPATAIEPCITETSDPSTLTHVSLSHATNSTTHTSCPIFATFNESHNPSANPQSIQDGRDKEERALVRRRVQIGYHRKRLKALHEYQISQFMKFPMHTSDLWMPSYMRLSNLEIIRLGWGNSKDFNVSFGLDTDDAAFLEEAIAILEQLRDPHWMDRDNEETLDQFLSYYGTNESEMDAYAGEHYTAQYHNRRTRIKAPNGGPHFVSRQCNNSEDGPSLAFVHAGIDGQGLLYGMEYEDTDPHSEDARREKRFRM